MITKKFRVGKKEAAGESAAAYLTSCANRYDCRQILSNGVYQVNPKSLLGVIALGIREDMELQLTADGSDEIQAAEAIMAQLM